MLQRASQMIKDSLHVYDGIYTLEGLYNRVHSGDWILWMMLERDEHDKEQIAGVYVTKVEQDDDGRLAVLVPVLGGKGIWRWGLGVMDALDDYAREIGADKVRCGGRAGWGLAIAGHRPIKDRYVGVQWKVT